MVKYFVNVSFYLLVTILAILIYLIIPYMAITLLVIVLMLQEVVVMLTVCSVQTFVSLLLKGDY